MSENSCIQYMSGRGRGGKDVGHFVWFSKEGRRAEAGRWRERGRELLRPAQ